MKDEQKLVLDEDSEVSDTSLIPETIGRYLVKGELGRGGMAIVYLAHDPSIPRDVAIKVIADEIFDNPEVLRHFQREVRFIAQLEHHAIVPVYDYGVHEGKPYLVMRHMQGGSLFTRLQGKEKKLSPQETSKILKRIVPALEKAHENGIIHRDIKPANILFDNEGMAHLSDFGVARHQSGDPPLTKAVGTPQYMAPEQWTGEHVDARTDVYQLGVTLFQMLTGRNPYTNSDLRELMWQHTDGAIPSARAISRDLPPECDEVLVMAMAKDPNHRYASPGALATALYRAFGEEKINRFQVQKELSRTHYSVIYKAHDPQIGQDVALKVLTDRLINDLTYQQRFRREADLIKALTHPAIVAVYDVGKYEERPYLAMQLIEGSTLAQRLQEEGPLSLDEVCFIAGRLATALEVAHSGGVVHRDVRPSNVLINEEGEFFLSDFGTSYIVRQTEAILHNHNSGWGAFPYRAPEQWKGEVVDARTDIYQFGVMLFEMLTGQVPFSANDPIAFMDKHLDKPVPSAHELNPDVPPNVDPILAKAMAKEPAQRYTKASELVAALNEARKQFELLVIYDEGRALYRDDRWQEAVETFERVMRIQEDYRDVQNYLRRAIEHKRNSEIFNKGQNEYQEGNWQNAIYYFNQISGYREADVLRAKAERNIELDELHRQGLYEYRQGNWVAAKEKFNKIDRIAPRYEKVDELLATLEMKITETYRQGKAEYDEGNWEEAILCLQPIAGDRNADHLLKLAQENKRRQELEDTYDKGIVAFQAKDWDRAKAIFEQIQRVQPNFRDVDVLLAEVNAKIREANSPSRRLRQRLFTLEGMGITLVIAVIVLAFVFEFLGIDLGMFLPPVAAATPATAQTPTLVELENCLETADVQIAVTNLSYSDAKFSSGESIPLSPGTADFQVILNDGECTDFEQFYTYIWSPSLGKLEANSTTNESKYITPIGSEVDALSITMLVPDSEYKRDFGFSIVISQ